MSADESPKLPDWVTLEPFVFRRDDAESFPDDSKASVRATGATSWHAPFRIAFSLDEPPSISRLYAQLPGFPKKQTPLAILATHRHLVLFRIATETPLLPTVQDFFIYSAENPSSLELLPPCTQTRMDYARRDRRSSRPPTTTPAMEGAPAAKPLLLAIRSMGVLCRGGGSEEFTVAELRLFKHTDKVYADICWFKSPGPGRLGGGEWQSDRVPILHSSNPDDVWQLCLWQTNAVIPAADRWLCWIDYHRGILFCDLFGGSSTAPTVSFMRLPLKQFPSTHNRSIESSWLYRGLSFIEAGGRVLKFVDVARDDEIGYGPLKPGAAFTVTCHTLSLDSMVWDKDTLGKMLWKEDSSVTSGQLWSAAYPPTGDLPREILMFPQVNITRPHVVHFLLIEFGYVLKKMWLVAIDMNTGSVESYSRYINGIEDKGTVDFDLTKRKSICPMRFFSSELTKYLDWSRI